MVPKTIVEENGLDGIEGNCKQRCNFLGSSMPKERLLFVQK